MATVKKTKAKKKAKNKASIDPQAIAQRRQKYAVRSLFKRLGLQRIKSDGVEFKFKERTGELDDIFIYENVVVLGEYTVGKKGTEHIAKKSLLYGIINNNQSEWMEFAVARFSGFGELKYLPSEYQVKICYFSVNALSDEVYGALDYVYFLNGTKFRYFDALAKTIHKSARLEFFKYLKLDFKKIGSEIKSSSSNSRSFGGFVLPESFSSFPTGFKVVSFYADPKALLTMSYVLRKDSWRDEDGLYQRVLMKGRMKEMRRYLTTEERVFVNNIIVTLPKETRLNEPGEEGKNIDTRALSVVRDVTVSVPFKADVIGIVDGQHRVFCYHEGDDQYEDKIEKLRDRQNLLVTGVIYPPAYADADKRRFEAKLFLEINDKQRRARSDLKHSIEMILSPYSTIAIAKAVVARMNSNGALRQMLQTNYFDPPRLIRTSSIVSYGLRPLLKLEGVDSLFSSWDDPDKLKLVELQKGKASQTTIDPILEKYIAYCYASLNDILLAARKKLGPQRWALEDRAKDRFLTPTLINGLIVCLRLVIQNGKPLSETTYGERFAVLDQVSITKYKSSSWKALGEAIYKKCF
ncbi:DGQHR domain-containing protein [Rhodanobacter sp. FW102-FHT14D07]|uniref:DGQHR domain-containing protein n=1 Tax=Rhodanobacter sp. FW102-FHT14D07 TaxID=3351462 RepID=A0AB74UXE4_9GAMM